MKLCDAAIEDAAELTEVAFAAKRYWGYPEAWIVLWADELTVGPAFLDAHRVRVVRDDGIVGWSATKLNEKDIAWLEACWVHPAHAGRGIGRRLVDDALAVANDLGATTMRVVSDPNAEGFYEKLGFARIGYERSRPAGRKLPVLERALGSEP